MGDPARDWYDGNGDPFQAPKYVKAKAALERPGKSPEFTRALDDAVASYERFYSTTGQRVDEPEPVDSVAEETAEPNAGPAVTTAPMNGKPHVTELPLQEIEGRVPPQTQTPLQMLAARKTREAGEGARGWLSAGGDALKSLASGFTPTGMAFNDSDYATGVNNPFSLGDEAQGFGGAIAEGVGRLMGNEPRVQTAGRGIDAPVDPRTAYEVTRDNERARQNVAAERSPFAYGAGKGLQEFAATAPLAAIPAAGAGRVAPAIETEATALFPQPAVSATQVAAGSGMQGAGMGALHAAGESEASGEQLAADIAGGGVRGGAAGAATGGLLAAAPRGLPAALPGAAAGAAYGAYTSDAEDLPGKAIDAAKYGAGGALLGAGLLGMGAPLMTRDPGRNALLKLGQKAARMRAGAAGGYASDLNAYAKAKGFDSPEQLGKEIERMGLHKKRGFGPATPLTYRANAAAAKQRAGAQYAESIDEGTRQGVAVPREDIIKGLRALARKVPNQGDFNQAYRAKTRQIAMDNRAGTPTLSPRALQSMKKAYEKSGGFKPDRSAPVGQSASSQAERDAAAVARSALDRSMREMAEQRETLPKFLNSREDYGVAATVEPMASKRAMHELGNQQVNLPTAVQSNVPAAIAMHALTRMGGKDATASALRAVQRASGGTGAAGGAAANAARGGAVLATSSAAGGVPAPPAKPTSGLRLRQRIEEEMDRDPVSLGDYSESIAEALDSGDEKLINAAIAKATDDPEIRRRLGLSGEP